jgi:hypothetical protein
VVGLAREIRSPSLDPLSDEPEMYHPLVVTREGRTESFGGANIMVALRCGAGCAGLDAIRRSILDLSAQAMIVRLGPIEEEYMNDIARPRAAAVLAACFAVVASWRQPGALRRTQRGRCAPPPRVRHPRRARHRAGTAVVAGDAPGVRR